MQYVSKTGSKDQEEQATSVIIARTSFSYLFLYLNLPCLFLQDTRWCTFSALVFCWS